MAEDILVELFDEDADPAEVDRVTLALRRELLDIDEVAAVSAIATGPAPEGSKGLTLAALGALAVTAQPTIELAQKLLGVLRSWLARSSAERTMRVTMNGHSIELVPTEEQQEELVRRFLEDAFAPAPPGTAAGPAPA